MTRIKTPASPHISPLSGLLEDRLKHHAYERCRHYFFYAFYLQALVDLWSTRVSQPKKSTDYVLTKASHQIDSGRRDNASHYQDFDRSAGVIKLGTTAFKKMDAAHLCNLGAQPALRSATVGGASAIEVQLYQNLCAIMGSTQQLPQQVNIGPDRVIDHLHSKLIMEHLQPSSATRPVATQRLIKQYLADAAVVMAAYQQLKTQQNLPGLAACAGCYKEVYLEPQFYNSLCKDILRAIEEDCAGYGLKRENYVA